jgi:hypothetical protein
VLSLKVNGQEFPLPVLTDEATERLQSWYDNGRSPDFLGPVDQDYPCLPERRIGSLYWPVVGASRFAYGVFAIDAYTLGQVRQLMGEDNRVSLVFRDAVLDDPVEDGREFPLFLLFDRPVSRTIVPLPTVVPPVDELYLIGLVDRRWYWTQQTGGGPTPESWNELLVSLFDRCIDAADFVYDAPPEEYLTPGPKWTQEGMDRRGTAAMLDDAARCIGMRVVVTPSSVHVQGPLEQHYQLAVGFQFVMSLLNRHGGGGLIDMDSGLIGIPRYVRVVWPDGTEQFALGPSGVDNTSVYADLSIPNSAGVSERTAALGRWGGDWREWQTPVLDAVYDGFLAPPSSGYIGFCELHHDGTTGYTRLSRPAHDYNLRIESAPEPELLLGCGLKHDDETDEYSVDLESLVGPPPSPPPPPPPGPPPPPSPPPLPPIRLIVVEGEEDECDYLAVDPNQVYPPPSSTLGCGLTNDGGVLGLDLSAVVFDGLYWLPECILGVNFGCGLEIGPGNENGSTLQVDVEQLAGDPAETALTVRLIAEECSELAVDLDAVTTTTELLVNDVTLTAIGGGLIQLSKTRTTYTNHFNAAGLHISRTAGSPQTTNTSIDVCLLQDCCNAATLTASFLVDQSDTSPCDYVFTPTVTGGVAPYTYLWDFGDAGFSALSNPTHTYAVDAAYIVSLVVTDACGNTASYTDSQACGSGASKITACCPLNGIPNALSLFLSGGTGGHAGMPAGPIALTYSGVDGLCGAGPVTEPIAPGWRGSFVFGGQTYCVILRCTGTDWFLASNRNPAACPGFIPGVGPICSPFSVGGTGELCVVLGGTITWSVTV